MPQGPLLLSACAVGYKSGMLCTFLRADRAVWTFVLAGALTCVACDDANESDDAGQVEDTGSADAGSGDARSDAGAMVQECKLDPPATCPTPIVRYADIAPILKARCISCHDGKAEQWPLLTYHHVADWYEQVREYVANCTMPPPEAGIKMTAAEREKIIAWVRCGYME